ncbi:DMT family transporter [Pseudarthrobacter sp. NPDC058196]|uniref:EamA family transporter n=1 Tax=Pseudarthrobacter sp. NPDC058196 TaxID=3346376 RepID=UPI0036D7AAD5
MMAQGEVTGFSRQKAGLLASVASLTLLQIGNAVAVGLIGSVGPAGATVLRIGIAALLTLPLIFLMKSSARVPARLILKYGLVLGLMQVTFYQAISTIDLSLAVSIEFTVPLVLGCLRSRNTTARLAAVLAVAGLFMIPAYNSTTAIEGMLFAAATGLLLAAYIRVGTSMPADNHPALTLCKGLWVALPISVAAFAVAPQHALPLTGELWLHALIVSVLTLLAPFGLELFAMKRLRGFVFALIAALDPALASTMGALALHQGLDLRQVGGIVLLTVCAGVAVYAESSTSPEKVTVS